MPVQQPWGTCLGNVPGAYPAPVLSRPQPGFSAGPASENPMKPNAAAPVSSPRPNSRVHQPWTNEEHELFLLGMLKYGKGK